LTHQLLNQDKHGKLFINRNANLLLRTNSGVSMKIHVRDQHTSVLICLLFFILLVFSPVSFGQTYGIPKTGQEAIYHSPTEYDLGGDGAIQAGYPLTGMRFQDNGDTVTDLGSGLMWQKKDSSNYSAGGLSGQTSWANAFNYVAALNAARFGGYSDWRVPNIKELVSISNKGTWLPATYYLFDGMLAKEYWSSTSTSSTTAYYVLFSDGNIQNAGIASSIFYVKAVRSYLPGSGVTGFPKTGQTTTYHSSSGNDKGDDGATQSGYPLSGDSFYNNGNGTITQRATGLIWQEKDSATQSFGEWTNFSVSWEDAFGYVAAMNRESFAGYSDWRLPNYFELMGLLSYSGSWPPIDSLFLSYTQQDYYWSSTNRYGPTPAVHAMAVWFLYPIGIFQDKNILYYVRAVRGGAFIPPTPPPPAPSPTPYPRRGLPKTGQTLKFHPSGNNDMGDDGENQSGLPLSGDRYTVGTETVSDNATGLMWQAGDSDTEISWDSAFSHIAGLNSSWFGGYNDWRMPNIKELTSLIDMGRWNPAIDPTAFPDTKIDSGYWGSTTYADMPNGRFCYQVSFFEGLTLWIEMNKPSMDHGYVRAVRSLQPEAGSWGFPKSGQTNIIHYPSGDDLGGDGAVRAGYPATGGRFVDNENGTVTDRATGLTWQKTDSAHQQVDIYKGKLSWEDAFNYIREMNVRHFGGYSRWRLPNYQELCSLLDFSQFYPALDPIFKSSVQSEVHWTSTARNLDSSNRWSINFTNGSNFWPAPTDKEYVIAVIGGPGHDLGPILPTPSTTPPGYKTPSPTPGDYVPTPIPVHTTIDHPYYGLPVTGQTTIYHGAGNNDPGDDGTTRIGYPVYLPVEERWEDLDNGVIIDWATGLMWQQSCSFGETFAGHHDTMTWDNGFAYISAMNQQAYGGYTDWRMPNCLELLSTRDLEKSPNTAPDIFTNTDIGPFWSSTCSANFSGQTQIFQMNFAYGQMLLGSTISPLSAVRACRTFYDGISPLGLPRTGQTVINHPAEGNDLGDDGAAQAGFPDSGPRFIDNGNGTIYDRATNLTWQQSCSTDPADWEGAFNYVASLNRMDLSGWNDWRLPNQMELYSIVDYDSFFPSINPLFTDTTNSFYWSSTTRQQDTTNAWAVNFGSGFGDMLPKNGDPLYIRAVRGEPVPGLRPTPIPVTTPLSYIFESGDYNGDGASDIAIFRQSSGLWSIRGVTRVYFGASADIPIPGDYNGNGRSDVGIFRAASGLWAIRGVTRTYFGSSYDTPVPGDYNGDGICDTGIYRPGSGLWAIRGVTRSYFGGSTDQPIPGDYNGDGTEDISIFRKGSGLWAMRSISRIYFGGSLDKAIPGNWDTTPGWDAGVFRPSSGLWAIRNVSRTYFGSGSDLPVPGDYNANGLDNVGIFRASSGLWAIKGVTRVYYGSAGDLPVTR